MARKRMVCIAKGDVDKIPQETIDALNKDYVVVCVSSTPIDVPNVKVMAKKPPAFLTLRSNSILFNGNVDDMITELTTMEGDSVALDFDGVINSYKSGWTGEDNVVDAPVNGIVDFVKNNSIKYELSIYSSRCKSEIGIKAMKRYFIENDMKELVDTEFSTEIDSKVILVDDRVVDYTKIDDIVSFVNNFVPWTAM